MQRYFAPIEGGLAILSAEDSHHLLSSVRIRVGENIEICCDGSSYLAEVTSLSPLRVEIKEEIPFSRELGFNLSLGFALLKGDHNDFIVEKGTELGCSCFYPLLTKRVIVKVQGEDNRLKRLGKIALSSARQSRRSRIPEVQGYTRFEDILSIPFDHRLMAYEGEAFSSLTIRKALAGLRTGKSVLILIGPEGGWSEEEVEKARVSGFSMVSLGKGILRAETAAIASLALAGDCLER